MNPLAIDLFCGLAIDLSQAELRLRANAAIKKLVTSRAQNPNHMALRIGDDLPSPISFELRLMSHFKNTGLSAGLAGCWKGRILSAKATDHRVLERSPGIVNLLFLRPLAVECPSLRARSLASAFLGAISAVGVRRHDVKMRPARETISTGQRDVRLLVSSYAPSSALALCRAVSLVGALCRKLATAVGASQFVHSETIS